MWVIWYFECLVFLSATDHRHIFCSSWRRAISEKSPREICLLARNPCFNKIFFRMVGAWHWKNAILSTAPRTSQHEAIWPIRAWYQNLVLWNADIKGMSLGRPFPLPRPPLGSLRSPIFFPVPRFLPFPYCGAWSQATAAEVRAGKQNDSDNLKVLYFKIKVSSKYIILVLKQPI